MYFLSLIFIIITSLNISPSQAGIKASSKGELCSVVVGTPKNKIDIDAEVLALEQKFGLDYDRHIKVKRTYKTKESKQGKSTNSDLLKTSLYELTLDTNNTSFFKKNTKAVESMYKLLSGGLYFDPSDLKKFKERLIKKLTKAYTLIKNKEKTYLNWVMDSQPVSKEYATAKLFAVLLAKQNHRKPVHLDRREAYNMLMLSYVYNFRYHMQEFPVLRTAFLSAFENYQPRLNSSIDNMIMLYKAVAKMKIKVPKTWHKVSMNWLIEHHQKMPIFNLILMYQNMLDTGIYPSLKMESLIYDMLASQKESLPKKTALGFYEAMAKAFIGPSVNIKKLKLLERHFEAFHYAIENAGFSGDSSLYLKFFYVNAVHRLGFFEDSPYGNVNKNIINHDNQKYSQLELDAKASLTRLYPRYKYKPEVGLYDFLPPVDLYSHARKEIIEVDGPSHETLFIEQVNKKPLSLTVRSVRDLDIVTQELYTIFGYDHWRLSYRLFNFSKDRTDENLLRYFQGHE